jgi:Flp pilus assembly protein TadD
LGNNLLDDNRLDEAIAEFAAGLAINPNESKLYLGAGKTFLEAGRLDQAKEALRTALKLDPKLDEAAFQMARVLRRKGENTEARAVLQKYLELHPDFASAWNNLGAIQAAQGDLTGAETSFQNAVTLKPETMDAWRNLIRLKLISNRPKEALGAVQQALQIKPDDADLWFQAGLLHEQIGQPDYARKNYEAALLYRNYWELPSESLAWLLVSQSNIPAQDAKKALALVNIMLARNKNGTIPPRWLELRGCALAANGEYLEAIKVTQAAKAQFLQLKDLQAAARNDEQIAAFTARHGWLPKQVKR